MGRVSGPMMDRFDVRVDVSEVHFSDLDLPPSGDTSVLVAERVERARARQTARYANIDGVRVNAQAEGPLLDEVATPDAEGTAFLARAAQKFRLSARGYHRVLRVARTIADLEGAETVRRSDIAEAVGLRVAQLPPP